jgi:hypothetical membrane protein
MRSHESVISRGAAIVAITAGAAQMACLAALHVLSPEFDPAWRVISEYAHGRYSWVLSMMFIFSGICVLALSYAIRAYCRSGSARAGLIFLILSGVGSVGAAFFDIDHPLHEVCGLLGVLGLPIAAMILSTRLARTTPWSSAREPLLWSAHLTWMTLALFIISMILLIVTYTRTGAPLQAQIPIGAPLPEGVVGVNGWLNRLLVVHSGL